MLAQNLAPEAPLSIRVLLVTQQPEVERICCDVAEASRKVELVKVGSFGELKLLGRNEGWHGLIVDMKTFLKSSREERMLLSQRFGSLPLAKVTLHDHTVMGVSTVGELPRQGFLNAFFQVLKTRAPQVHRQFARTEKILNLRVLVPGTVEPILSNSLDISEGGMFLVTSEPAEIKTALRIEVADWPGFPPLQAVVRWVLPWGKSQHHLPGMGVQFEAPTEEQKVKLLEF